MVHLDSSDYVLFLGAGASVEPGLPTAFQMTERFKDEVRQRDDFLARTLSLILGGIQFLRGQQGIFPEANTNIEDVAETIDALRKRHYHRVSPFVGAWNELLSGLDGTRTQGRDCLLELQDILFKSLSVWLETPPIGEIRHFQALRDFVQRSGTVDLLPLITICA